MKSVLTAVLSILFLSSLSMVEAVEEYELDNEINRTVRQIEKARAEYGRTIESIQADKKEYQDYRRRVDRRKETITSRTDSINAQRREISAVNDSLEAVYASLETREKEYRYMQSRLRKVLVSLCDSVADLLSTLPPSGAESSLDAVRFLRSEMIGGRVDNIEAMQRLFSILGDVEEEAMNIAMLHGPSPVPQINGMVNRVRIGAVFEAAVGQSGTQVALWDVLEGQWFVVDDSQLVERIRKAIAVREGKEIPSMIPLPLNTGKMSRDTSATSMSGGVQ
ncbi:MAG: DUF3450 family protein [Chitinispirillaceae bacterium]